MYGSENIFDNTKQVGSAFEATCFVYYFFTVLFNLSAPSKKVNIHGISFVITIILMFDEDVNRNNNCRYII